MNTRVKRNALKTIVFALCIIASAAAAAYGGWHGNGGYHNYNNNWHNNNYNNWHNNGWHYNNWNNGGAVIINVPDCQTIKVCNGNGQCWMQQQCN